MARPALWVRRGALALAGVGLALVVLTWAGQPVRPPVSPAPAAATIAAVSTSEPPTRMPAATASAPAAATIAAVETPEPPTRMPATAAATEARSTAPPPSPTVVTAAPTATPAQTPTATRGPTAAAVTASVRPTPTANPTPTATPRSASKAPLGQAVWEGRPRWCAGGGIGDLTRYNIGPLRMGWYLDWQARADLVGGGNAAYARMVRMGNGALVPDASTLERIARAHPGALWLIGNEPDVKVQDNVTPADYARLYHEAYSALKRADPRAQVAIGGVSQPTPLRLRYLDAVLAAYREQFGTPMPVDVWNVHNFVLREERGSWGVDIPPGMADDRGLLYEIADGANLEAFKGQIVAFRRWMADRGFRDHPLIVSEYGILMPEDFGFPPATVAAFLTGTFDYFLAAVDPNLGYAADGNRLVQAWCWYSLADTVFPTGNLFDPESANLTALGRAWAAYVQNR